MNASSKSTTLSSRLFAIASRIQTASACQQIDAYVIDSNVVAICSDFASSEQDLRVVALLYSNLLNPDERRAHVQMNVRLLLGTCFGTHAIAQMIDHLQTMINRDLVQLEYRSQHQHDHILSFTSAGLNASVQLTDRALFCIQNAEAAMLESDMSEQHDDTITTDDSKITIEFAEDYEKYDDEEFRSSPGGQAVDEIFGKKDLLTKQELPDAFLYVPDEAIQEQYEEIVALCSTDIASQLRQYGVSAITAHAKRVKHDRMTILLSGAPGTGKTAAAYALAQQLNRELYITSVDVLNSPYHGVFERNTRRVMREFRELSITSDAAPILLIDECEALFSERTRAHQSGDRAFNSVIDVLLQEMERFEGILILTTNTPDVFDEAFRRRLDFKLHLSGNSVKTQRSIWELRMPAIPGANEISINELVERFNFSAADITMIVRRAVQTSVMKNPQSPRLTQAVLVQACERHASRENMRDASAPFGFV